MSRRDIKHLQSTSQILVPNIRFIGTTIEKLEEQDTNYHSINAPKRTNVLCDHQK